VSDHAGLLAEVEVRPGAVRNFAAHAPAALAMARRWLELGRAEATRRQQRARALSGMSLLSAASIALSGRRVSRRTFLRAGAYGGSLMALLPSVGFSLLSEMTEPDEMRAFDALLERLATIEPPESEVSLLARSR
jgi:hypothetical protein